METLATVKEKLIVAGFKEVYEIVSQHALASLALTDKELHKILVKDNNTSYPYYEEFDIYVENNQSEILEAILKNLGLTIKELAI